MEWVAGDMAGSLFTYNRENFMFDRNQRIKREYQGQEMRIIQFELYREDVRDLIDLTVSKMDNYLIISTLQLGFCVSLFTEGRPSPGKQPMWMFWLYAITTASAFLYFLLSIWLAMHASIAAHSFGVRLLTQFVRLPIPDRAQLDAAKSTAAEFEGASARELLRVPALRQQLRRLQEAMARPSARDAGSAAGEAGSDEGAPAEVDGHAEGDDAQLQSPAALLRHTQLYRDLQANWQAYDAYARVSMATGTNQLLHSLSYFCLMQLMEGKAPVPACCVVALLSFVAWLLARLDLFISRRLLNAAGLLLIAPPVVTVIGVTIESIHASRALRTFGQALVPLVFLLHTAWIAFIIYLCYADRYENVALPTKFRSVLFLDVFGWLGAPRQEDERAADAGTGAGAEATANDAAVARAERLSTVAEESARDTQTFVAQGGLPPGMRASLASLCHRVSSEAQRDLEHWESEGVRAYLDEEADIPEKVARLRSRLDASIHTLDELHLESFVNLASASSSAAADRTVWLKLVWSPSGRPMDFFYNPQTGATTWALPPAADRISDLELLSQALDVLEEKAGILAAHWNDEATPLQAPTSTAITPQAVHFAHPPGRFGEESDSASVSSISLSPPEEDTRVAGRQSVQLAEGSAMREDTRFGGRESVQLAEGSAMREGFFGTTAEAQASFHPTTTQADGGGPAAPTAVGAHRRPGLMPWRTFCQGSAVLIILWLCGLVWSVASAFGWDLQLTPVPTEPGEHWASAPESLPAVSWPHQYFNPRSLACHDSLENVAFVAEAFAVYEVRLDGRVGQHPKPAFESCIAEHPDFLAGGLRGISLECKAAGRCDALLLAASGGEVLRCQVDNESTVTGAEGPTAGSARLRLHGAPWQALAPVGEEQPHGTQERAGLWALGAGGLLARLEARLGTQAELVPDEEVPVVASQDAAQMQALSGDLLLGLEPDGRVHAWRPASGANLGSWRLRTSGGKRWAGICASRGELYALSAPAGEEAAALWRTQPPLGLRS